MVEKKLIALSLICVVLAVGLFGALMLLNQKDAEMQIKTNQIPELESEKLSLEAQVSNLQYNVSGLQSEVGSLNNDNVALESQVTSLQSEITSINNEKTTLENQVSGLQTEITTLENEKNTLETQVSTIQTNVSSLQTQVTSLEDDKNALEEHASVLQANVESLQSQVESLEYNKTSLEIQVASLYTEVANLEVEVIQSYYLGYDEGYAQGVEDGPESGWYIRDPTYDEAIAFINSDETDENEYTPDYVCYDFTADFDTNAFQMGYRCGFVYIEFSDSAHAIACFNTTDSGLIYIEPQNDEIVDIAVGQLYLGHIIIHIGIIW